MADPISSTRGRGSLNGWIRLVLAYHLGRLDMCRRIGILRLELDRDSLNYYHQISIRWSVSCAVRLNVDLIPSIEIRTGGGGLPVPLRLCKIE
jgi:hypothetical protein